MDDPKQEQVFETLKSCIVELKSFTEWLRSTKSEITASGSTPELKQFVDEQGLHIKHLPMSDNTLFRVFSDTLLYKQTRCKEVKFALNAFVQNNHKRLTHLLECFDQSEWALENYISQLMMGVSDFEITLALLWELFNKNAEIYFQSLPNSFNDNDHLLDKVEKIPGTQGLMKFSLFKNDSWVDSSQTYGEVVGAKRSKSQLDWYKHALHNDEVRPNLKLSMYWFTGNSSFMVIVDRNTYSQPLPNPSTSLGVSNQAFCISQAILLNIINSSTVEKTTSGIEDEDEYWDFEWFENDRKSDIKQLTSHKTENPQPTNEVAKPTTMIKALDKEKSLSDEIRKNNLTPNTASGSSVSGSNKFIRVSSKLKTGSRVYNGNSNRLSNSSNPSLNSKNANSTKENLKANQCTSHMATYYQSSSGESGAGSGQVYKSEHYKNNTFGAFPTPLFMDRQKEKKINIPYQSQKFSSDTKLNIGKEFSLYPDETDEIEEFNLFKNHQESDWEDDSGRMAKCIPNNIFDDIETNHNSSAKKNWSKFTFKQPETKDLDCGSVSSGSEKDSDMHFHPFKHPKNIDPPLSPTNSKKYAPNSDKQNNTKQKESQGYNSLKNIPSSTFEPIMEEGSQQRMSPQKPFEKPASMNTVNQCYDFSNQNYPSYTIKGSGMYAPPGYGYQPMPVNTSAGYYHSHNMNMSAYNMHPNQMYPQQYVPQQQPQSHQQRTHPNMKNNSDNIVHRQALFSNKNLSVGCKTSKMMNLVPMRSESDQYNQSISYYQGAPGLLKNMPYQEPSSSDKINKANPLLSGNFASRPIERQSDPNVLQPTNLGLQMTASAKAKEANSKLQSNNLSVPQPMMQPNKQIEKSRSSPCANNNSSKKSKKGKKSEKRKKEKMTGRLKFFDEAKNYGFMVVDNTQQDMFVHYDDLKKTMISKDMLSSCKDRYSMRFTFHVFEYAGKNKDSKKAVDIKLVSILKMDPKDKVEIAEPVLLATEIDPLLEISEAVLSNFFNS